MNFLDPEIIYKDYYVTALDDVNNDIDIEDEKKWTEHSALWDMTTDFDKFDLTPSTITCWVL